MMKNIARTLRPIRPRHVGAAIFILASLAGAAVWGAGIYLNILREEAIPAPFRQIIFGSFAVMLACMQVVSIRISVTIFQGEDNPEAENSAGTDPRAEGPHTERAQSTSPARRARKRTAPGSPSGPGAPRRGKNRSPGAPASRQRRNAGRNGTRRT